MRFRTRAIHVGNERDPRTGAVIPPLHLASTYVQPAAGEWGAFDYSRSGNPTRANLETTLASLESGTNCLAFSSGMAAIHCVTMLLEAGDHVVAGADVYGGTYRLLHRIMNRSGVTVTLAKSDRIDQLEAAFTPKTKLLWIESPGNPLLSITDIAGCAELAKSKGVLLGVDNTFASPVLTRPLELGADIVMHSATKYLGGHSDMLGGGARRQGQGTLRPALFRAERDRRGDGAARRLPLHARTQDAGTPRPRTEQVRASHRRAPRRPSESRVGLLPRPAGDTPATRSPRSRCKGASAASSASISKPTSRPASGSSTPPRSSNWPSASAPPNPSSPNPPPCPTPATSAKRD